MFDEVAGDLVEVNHTLNESLLFVQRNPDASKKYLETGFWYDAPSFEFTKYQVKETDMRVKTATFTSPHYFDLTTGQFCVLIVSPYHENFSGIILKVEYDEGTGLYSYQCQDMTRFFMEKGEIIAGYIRNTHTEDDGKQTVTYKYYDSVTSTLYEYLFSQGSHLNITYPVTGAKKNQYAAQVSGIRPLHYYDYTYQGSVIKGNGLDRKEAMIARDKTRIEILRTLAFSGAGVKDVYVDKNGILQVVPDMAKGDTTSEMHIEPQQASSLKITFDTTNVITTVKVANTDKLKPGNTYTSDELIGLNLDKIFGYVDTQVSNPNQSSSANKVSSTSSSSSSGSTSSNGNPFNSKAKKAWVDADSGSCDFKSSFISELKKNGWTVKDGGCGPNTHYLDYSNVSSDYSILVNIYNGFCAGTIQEAYSSSIQNKLKNKGVQLVIVFDTRNWTDPHGMKPYRNGNFDGYTAHRAWDDNFSSGDPTIRNVGQWFKDKGAVYCAGPSVSDAMKQFNAGGYFKLKK